MFNEKGGVAGDDAAQGGAPLSVGKKKLRVIHGGKDVAEPETPQREMIAKILREVDDAKVDQFARILLATIKREHKERWLVVALAVIAACALEAVLFLVLYR
jgi:hypothetical protein